MGEGGGGESALRAVGGTVSRELARFHENGRRCDVIAVDDCAVIRRLCSN